MDEPWRIDLLGPLRVTRGGDTVDIGPIRLQAVLAVLALDAGHWLTAEALLDAVWGSDHPSSGVKVLPPYIYRLRKALSAGGNRADPVDSDVGRYRLRSPLVRTDLDDFRRTVEAGKVLRRNGDSKAAGQQFEAALRWWRGTPLAGLPGPVAEQSRASLHELHHEVEFQALACHFHLQDGVEVVPGLSALHRRLPHRADILRLLMVALARDGQIAEALELYHRFGRTGCADADLVATHQSLVGATPLPARRERSSPGVCTLPRDVDHFVGRDEALALLQRSSAGVTFVHGPAGVGKSVLAVHLAHTMAHRYPDGQLYVESGRTPGDGVNVAVAVGRAVRAAAGSPARPGAPLADLLAGRRMLIVVDNVGVYADLRELDGLGTGSRVVLVGHRPPVSAVVQQAILVEPLTSGEARDLLIRAAALDRYTDSPATARLAELGRGLPLAIEFCAVLLRHHPSWGPDQLLERSGCTTEGLMALVTADMDLDVELAAGWDRLRTVTKATLPGSGIPLRNEPASRTAIGDSWPDAVWDDLWNNGFAWQSDAGVWAAHPLLDVVARRCRGGLGRQEPVGRTLRTDSLSS